MILPSKRVISCLMLVLLLGLTMPLAAQDDDSEAEDVVVVIPEGDTVRIGIGVDLSNIIPGSGVDVAQTAELFFMGYNENGGILGFDVEVISEDDLCTEDGALVVAEIFVEDPNIVAVIGHLCSGASIPASEIYEEARIPMVSPSSTAGAFTARGLDVTNRTAFNDNIQGVVAARFIYQVLDAQKIAIFHNGTAYGQGIATTVSETYAEEGGEVAMFEGIDPENGDFTPLLEDMVELGVDLLYLGGYDDEGILLVEQMAELGIEDITFFSNDGLYTQDFLDGSAGLADGTYVTFGTQEGDPQLNREFDEAYSELFGVSPDELGPYHSQAYDAAQMIALALESVAELDDDGNLVIDRNALIEAIRSTSDLEGLTGIVNCDENGDCGSGEISVFLAEGDDWFKIGVPASLQVQ